MTRQRGRVRSNNHKAGAIPAIDFCSPEAGTAEGILQLIAVAGELQCPVGDTGLLHTEPGPLFCGERRQEIGMLRCTRIDEDLSRCHIRSRTLEPDHGLLLSIAHEVAKNGFLDVVMDMIPLRTAIFDFDSNRMIRIAAKSIGKIAPIDLL